MHRIVHVVMLVCLVVVMTGGGPLTAAAQDGGKQDRGEGAAGELDLSAMLLTPLDLADAGLEGYGYAWGGTDTLDGEYASLISFEDEVDETLDVLDEAGFVQDRWALLDLPSEEDPDFAARRVGVFIDEYTGTDGLSEVMEIYLNFGNEIEETSGTIGDESFITGYTDTDSDTGVDVTALVVVFRYENQIGQINVSDYATQSPDIEPTTEEIEALAERLFERMVEVREEGSPGIEHQLLRFESDGQLVSYSADYYIRLDDTLFPRFGQDEELLEGIDEAEQSFGMTDAYRLVQTITATDELVIQWGSQVRRFADEEGAGEWIDSSVEWLEISGANEVEAVDADLEIGDATSVVSYVTERSDATFFTLAIFIQIGDTGINSQISYPGEVPDVDAVAEIAEMQAECVEAGGCPIETAVPDVLMELVEALQ
jgi:hypothetical protein